QQSEDFIKPKEQADCLTGYEYGSRQTHTQLLIAQKEEAGIQLQAEEYDLMAAAADLDEIEEVNANCILMANLQQASSSGTQTDSAPVYDSDGSAEVHESYDNTEIFNMFTQEKQYTELLEPIPEPQHVPQNDSNVISKSYMSKWGFRKKIDERGIVMRNKARMVAQGHTQEEGIDYDEVFLPVAMIKAIRLFLAYASFKDFMVYQMDVKSAFLYEKIEKEVYVCQPIGFEDLDFLDKVYKVEKALYRLHQAPRACSMGELTFFLGLEVKPKQDRIFISHDKYVAENLKKYGFFEVKTVSTPMKTQKPLLKDEDGEECKKQTVVENFTTEAEYVAASSCCGQVLWIQNQLLDY
nr:copia protein [Tanacetum cinerariifolium]